MSDKADKTHDLLKEISKKLGPVTHSPKFWTCSECKKKNEELGEICEYCGMKI